MCLMRLNVCDSVRQQVNIQSPESAMMILVDISELLNVSRSDETVAKLSVDSLSSMELWRVASSKEGD